MNVQILPWYREVWPWFIIGLLTSCVVACLLTLAIAIQNPVQLTLSESQYQAVKAGLTNSAPRPGQADDDG